MNTFFIRRKTVRKKTTEIKPDTIVQRMPTAIIYTGTVTLADNFELSVQYFVLLRKYFSYFSEETTKTVALF